MNLTSQYVVKPKSKKTYSTIMGDHTKIKYSKTRLRVGENRQYLNLNTKHGFYKLDNIVFRMIQCKKGLSGDRDIELIERPFSLGETEVTQELFKKVMGFNPSYHKGDKYLDSNKRPVEGVTWYDAVMFCNKLSMRLGKTPYYDISNFGYDFEEEAVIFNVKSNHKANGFRLPLRREWVYAAKAGTDNRWAGTNDLSKVDSVAWFGDNSTINNKGQTHPVKGKMPNEWGFYDMSGNVSEWCSDVHRREFLSFVANVQGGSWRDSPNEREITKQEFSNLSNALITIGFRVAL